jgi:hypothetical protein
MPYDPANLLETVIALSLKDPDFQVTMIDNRCFEDIRYGCEKR